MATGSYNSTDSGEMSNRKFKISNLPMTNNLIGNFIDSIDFDQSADHLGEISKILNFIGKNPNVPYLPELYIIISDFHAELYENPDNKFDLYYSGPEWEKYLVKASELGNAVATWRLIQAYDLHNSLASIVYNAGHVSNTKQRGF